MYRGWLLGTGVVLTAGLGVLVALLVFTEPPVWLWSMLSIAPWGPITLVLWALLARRARFVRRLTATGIRTHAPIAAIGQTASQIGARPVLRLHLLVHGRPVTVRSAPPAHLLGALRPGVPLPVLVDPHHPTHVLPDWSTAEREL